MGSLCKCGTQRQRNTSGPTSNFPGRQYYLCPDCKTFEWADQAVHLAAGAGPTCSCGKATVQRSVKKDGPNKGRKFWGCATWPGGCRHFEFQEIATPPRAVTVASSSSARPPLPGYCQHLTDWRQQETLQQMMTCDPTLLGHGRDVRQAGDYDKLEVVGAWHITNQTRKQTYTAALRRVGAMPVTPEHHARLPADYAQAASRLGGDPLDSRSGEVFLLHGTEPQHLHSILFEGLDPTVAADGLFGRGTYFAESAGKIDQYATVDHKFQSDGPLSELHEKLYTSAAKHPGRVHYALVCRVALGRPAVTKDGQTRLEDNATLFSDGSTRASLAPLADGVLPQSLRAETGGRVQRFREYVVFSPDQILVEYLVAYQRKRTLCDCGLRATEKTVVNGENRGRKCHFCHWPQDDARNCGYIVVFPQCPCGRKARVRESKSGRNYYTCGNTQSPWCDWFGGWADGIQVSSTPPSRKRSYGHYSGGYGF